MPRPYEGLILFIVAFVREAWAMAGKSSKEDCKGLATHCNGFHTIKPGFYHGRVGSKASSLTQRLPAIQANR